jgi:hypothetical protein
MLSVMLMITAGVGTAAAGCGWPSCNPARLANTYSKTITPPGGRAGTITVHFQSTEAYPGLETWVTFSGTSYGKWLGSTPFNASKVTLTDHMHVDGISVNVSYPPGFTGSGSDVSFTNSVSNNWQVNHSFDNIHFTCFACFGIAEDATATFQFGSSFYTISTHDDALV